MLKAYHVFMSKLLVTWSLLPGIILTKGLRKKYFPNFSMLDTRVLCPLYLKVNFVREKSLLLEGRYYSVPSRMKLERSDHEVIIF